MAKIKQIEERAEALLKPVAEENGVRIYDVEYVKEGPDWFLRLFIDRDGGVTIDDCEAVSRKMSDLLDAEDCLSDPYTLEVSSPGLGRILKKDRHFSQSIGEEVECRLFKPPEGMKEKEFSGILKGFDRDSVTIQTGEDGKELSIERKNLAVIRLALDF